MLVTAIQAGVLGAASIYHFVIVLVVVLGVLLGFALARKFGRRR